MDRLSLVALLLLAVGAGCTRDGESSAVPQSLPSRVDAVPAKHEKQETPKDFCDVWTPGSDAKSFAYPALADADPAPQAGKAWRWINVWATWCVPCIEEMPMLARWKSRLSKAGAPLEMVFLSVDEEADAVASYRRKHPEMPVGPRVQSMNAVEGWLTTLGLDATAAIPIHVFVDPEGKTRCVRTGALSDHHYDVIARLVAGKAG